MSGFSRELLIVAGEESGERYGARLVRELLGRNPSLRISGMGGDRMASAGMEVLTHIDRTASIGIVEAGQKLFFLYGVLKKFGADLRRGRYAGVVLIDYPDFNIQLAKIAHREGVPVFYYIPPQIWAWRKYRVRALKRFVDRIIVALPFEKLFYMEHGIEVEFFGHPLLDEIQEGPSRSTLREEAGVGPGEKLVGIMPGSRKTEIRHILPVVVETCSLLQARHPGMRFVLPVAPSLPPRLIENVLKNHDFRITVVEGRAYEVMRSADFLIAKSGTTTLEALIHGVPMVIVYRGPWLSYWFVRYLVRVQHVGLPNLLAGRGIVRELLQSDATPEKMMSASLEVLDRPEKSAEMKAELIRLKRELGERGVAGRAAALILERIGYA